MPSVTAIRTQPAGLRAGAAGARIAGPAAALGLVAEPLLRADRALRGLVQTDVSEVPEIAGYLLDAGGKRLRPALTALGARAIGTEPSPRLMCVGELLHLGSLLHDDVVDEAPTRRGRAAAHRVHGNAVTVLTGDFCLARAVWLAAEEGGHEAVRTLGETVTQMAEGELLQLRRAGDLSCSTEQYLDVVARKSAELISWCAAAPAWAAERPEDAAALARFGRAVGIAFQITDDVLDYAEGTGKLPGADLRERKVTLPLLLAMERDASLREELQAAPPAVDDLPAWMERIRATGALDDARAEATRRADRAVRALGVLPATEGREALALLARYLVERTA